eukprot:maker-scaffold127_size327531-snap-gene-0.8 protein:Tk07869 transcript:maker-scaffold127_size327531-snap-gene-0.8-mRNA-1 annotation:"PREDICTED: uncharacterized protein LOC100161421"
MATYLSPVKILALFLILALSVEGTKKSKPDGRTARLFSLFNIVTFTQASCVLSSDNSMRGTCMTNSECTTKSGSSDGSCAAGFGVCCSFVVKGCGGSISQNCTYIQNSEFPATASPSQDCTYTFNRICDNLCQIRLDFDNFVVAQPPSIGMGLHGDCVTSGDVFTVTSPTGKSPPVTCGTLTGQHMFIETGSTGTAATAKIDIGALTGTRTYKIKATYYQCDSLNKAPTDCVQYFTGVSGGFQSYNFQGGQLIDNQAYTTCFRQEEGFCEISYSEASSSTTPAFDLYISAAFVAPEATRVAQNNAAACNVYVQIPSTTTTSSVHCGGVFSPLSLDTVPGAVRDQVAPFQVTTVFSDKIGIATETRVAGYSLEFAQVPC